MPTSTNQADPAVMLGAGILGAVLGSMAVQSLGMVGFIVPLVLFGVALRSWGMSERRQDGAAPRFRWANVFSWSYWAVLASLIVFILIRH